MRELLERDRLGRARRTPVARAARSSAVELAPAVPDPDKIVCIGLNYRAHAAEAGIDPPQSPTIFGKYRNALAAPRRDRRRCPRRAAKVDFEAEVAFVVGRRRKEVDAADALEHVAGYTLLNDLSARDLQFATPQWMAGQGVRRLGTLRARRS